VTISRIELAGPIPLVYSNRFTDDLENRLTPFFQEVDGLARQGSLPATLAPADRGWKMAVHAARHVAWMYPTAAGDAFYLGHAAPRRFKDEERLLAGALLVRCTHGVRPFPDLTSLNQAFAAGHVPRVAIDAERLWTAWHAAARTPDPPAATPSAHARYLELLDEVVEAGRRIETDRQAAAPPQHYVSFGPATERRFSTRGTYRFRMTAAGDLTVNTMISLGDDPAIRGQVIRVDGREVTVRFEPGADFDRIPGQGTLRLLPGDRIFRAQRDAIAQLRRGAALNPDLLSNLVDARFRPYRPATGAPPARLDEDQAEAFHRVLEVPDMLCVLGPPGAGKTTTIIEAVRACAARGKRVLVTSHTHRAVDNVLEGLPTDLNVVRIGNEDRMTDRVKRMSAGYRVESIRRDILADSALVDALSAVREQRPLLDRHLADLTAALDRARLAQEQVNRLGPAIDDAAARATASLGRQLGEAEYAVASYRSLATGQEAALIRADGRVRAAHARASGRSPLAFVHRWVARWQQGRLARMQHRLAETRTHLDRAVSGRDHLSRQVESVAAQDPLVNRLRADHAAAERTVAGCWPEMTGAAELLRAALLPVVDPPPVPPPASAAWADFHGWGLETVAMLCRRVDLLREWRERVGDLNVGLQHEVARYAQVVGATCIGTDTSALISDLEFDLAIVDEAGQISTPNLLVPLVRAHRAMLVGDHKQLPPYLDEDVRAGMAELGANSALTTEDLPAATDLLAKSGFELLFPRAGRDNSVVLRTQRRMPAPIAEFVSATFYDGQLRTAYAGGGAGTVFASPFAMVDTSDRAPADRGETAMSGVAGAHRHGYRNSLEAGIIASLVRALELQYRDWAVIVPFNAQKELVVQRLEAVLGSSSRIRDNVGTVDSFQGGERDLILFGFTRSNPRGDIGFLRELRRFNVAITRAKRQLVLVGDLSTLRNSRNEAFRQVILAMTRHLAAHGDRRLSRDVDAVLTSAAGRPR
jgi:hypothetical protein